jgi:16S rRNA (cytidine1402-2'-O)-methyltransferase
MSKGKIFMIPNVIADDTQDSNIPSIVKDAILKTDVFLVEDLRTARRYISSLKLGLVIESLEFQILDKKTSFDEIFEILQPAINDGKNFGVISESGCPGIADPGAKLVHLAHQFGLKVVPFVGPSSILLALMASGFNGQSFAFHGYLPIDKKERITAIKKLECDSFENNQTQIFMDTPYRNEKLFLDIIKTCRKDSFLCLAKDITGKQEQILSKPIAKWKQGDISMNKIPTIFLLYSQ